MCVVYGTHFYHVAKAALLQRHVHTYRVRRNAAIGSRCEARIAGYSPKMRPTPAETTNGNIRVAGVMMSGMLPLTLVPTTAGTITPTIDQPTSTPRSSPMA